MTHVELSRRERKKEETRRRIFSAAVELFRAKGFEETTVDEITEKADVGRGTFFNYFPRKEAVLAYLSEGLQEATEEDAAGLLESSAPARARLVDLYQRAASAYESDRELSRWVFTEWMKRGFAPGNEAGQRLENLVLAMLEQGRASGELRADVPARRAHSMISGVYVTTLYEWLLCSEGCPPDARIDDLRGELALRLGVLLDGLSVGREVRS